jgi:tetratricopeptide (TPR) repeat protein
MKRSLLFVAAVALVPLAPPVRSAHADWGDRTDPFNPKEVATYKAILVRNPHDAGALAKLLDKYRRFRTIDLLKEEYTKILTRTPDDWATLVVLGNLYKKTADEPRALEMWARAVAKRDHDAATWLAIGEAHKGGG